ERQRIKGALAHPQRTSASLQRCSIEVALRAREMIMALRLGNLLGRPYCTAIEVHEATIERGMRKDHAATAPVAGRMRPGARRRIAHTALLRQGQGNASLLQVRFPTTAGQGGLERGELLREVRPRWGGRPRRLQTRRERLRY